jgi:hypothetical protein
VLACLDLGKGIFGELGGQGGSLRKSLSKRDLSSPPASDRQGGHGGRGGVRGAGLRRFRERNFREAGGAGRKPS